MRRPPDSKLDAELHDELMRSRHAGHDYDVLAKLPQLRAALEASQTTVDEPAGDPGSAAHGGSVTGAVAAQAGKLILVAATVGATAFVAWSEYRRPAPAERSAPSGQVAPAAAVPEPPTPKAEPAATAVPASEAAASQPVLSDRPPTRSSRREIAQLVRVRELLERDPAAAYHLAQQYAREFPNGVLREEGQALQVLALAKWGAMDAAEREAKAFFARYPQSPMRKRLEAALRRQ